MHTTTRRGASGSSRTFTDEQAAEVCRKYLAGATITELALAYQCSTQPIRNTLKWAGVELRRSSGGSKKAITVTHVNPYTGCLTLSSGERVPHPGRAWKVGETFLRAGQI